MSIHPNVLQNSRVLPATDKLMSPGQVGLLAGWGVFSTLRIQDGHLFEYPRHWARMVRDAARMHVPLEQDPEEVLGWLSSLIAANRVVDGTLRVAVVRNRGGLWEGPSPTGLASDVMAMTADLKAWPAAVSLMVQPDARHAACEFAGTKILSWAQNLTWAERAQQNGFDEMLLLNERGEVAECTSANVFVVQGSQVFTPPLGSGCLAGITREVLLEEIEVPGVKIAERALRLEDLKATAEVFITSTTRDLLPVERVGPDSLRTDGDVRARLSRAFEAFRNARQPDAVASGGGAGRVR